MELKLLIQGVVSHFAKSLHPIFKHLLQIFADVQKTWRSGVGTMFSWMFSVWKKDLIESKNNWLHSECQVESGCDLPDKWLTTDMGNSCNWLIPDCRKTVKWFNTDTHRHCLFLWTCSTFWETASDKQWVTEDRIIITLTLPFHLTNNQTCNGEQWLYKMLV